MDRLNSIMNNDVCMAEENSELEKFYRNSTILITGATGLLGKLTMEKLLRSCNVNKIFIIVRSKKEKDPQTRLKELFDDPCMEPLKKKFPNAKDKIFMVPGDANLPNFGLNDEDIQLLKAEVEFVFHYAATVRFDEKLRTAANINVRAVRDLVRLAKDMKKLKAFVHISTAYSNCVHTTIEEKLYEPPITSDKLLTLIDCLNDNRLEAITKSLIGDYPNTYTFTKCVAEEIIFNEGKQLPIAIYRPSIVISTAKEPIAGWISNVYGVIGVVLGASIGLLRTLHGCKSNKTDMVPADYVSNSVIATGWDVACNKRKEDFKNTLEKTKETSNTPIYNYVCTPESPITWDEFHTISRKHLLKVPSEKCLWYGFLLIIKSKWLYTLALFLLHTIPSHIVDFIAMCLGKEQMMVKSYRKINKFSEVFSYFISREWVFTNKNIQKLWKKLNKEDQLIFEFNMKNFDWEQYFHTFARGGRMYLLQDPLETIPKGKIKYIKLTVAHYTLVGLILAGLVKICMVLLSCIF